MYYLLRSEDRTVLYNWTVYSRSWTRRKYSEAWMRTWHQTYPRPVCTAVVGIDRYIDAFADACNLISNRALLQNDSKAVHMSLIIWKLLRTIHKAKLPVLFLLRTKCWNHSPAMYLNPLSPFINSQCNQKNFPLVEKRRYVCTFLPQSITSKRTESRLSSRKLRERAERLCRQEC